MDGKHAMYAMSWTLTVSSTTRSNVANDVGVYMLAEIGPDAAEVVARVCH
jgi:hypothetical protein